MKIKCSKYVKEHVTKELMQQLVLLYYQIPCKKAHAFRFEQTKTHTRIHHLVEDTMLTTELKKMDVPFVMAKVTVLVSCRYCHFF